LLLDALCIIFLFTGSSSSSSSSSSNTHHTDTVSLSPLTIHDPRPPCCRYPKAILLFLYLYLLHRSVILTLTRAFINTVVLFISYFSGSFYLTLLPTHCSRFSISPLAPTAYPSPTQLHSLTHCTPYLFQSQFTVHTGYAARMYPYRAHRSDSVSLGCCILLVDNRLSIDR